MLSRYVIAAIHDRNAEAYMEYHDRMVALGRGEPLQARPQSWLLIRSEGTQDQIDADTEWERTRENARDWEFTAHPRAPGI